MLYILTVHWESDCWIDIQLSYLKKHINVANKKFAFLNIDTKRYDKFFDYSSHENIRRHASKLNILADLACFDSSSDDDLLMFVDGDAFPISNLMPYVKKELSSVDILAVKREENLEDRQPHPCFCVIPVGLWKKYQLDWNPGHFSWIDSNGKTVRDVGGKILKAIERNHLSWKPLLRTNRRNPHPLNYGVYGDLVYHHGAGFRSPATRIDLHIANRKQVRTKIYSFANKILPRALNKRLLRPMNSVVKKNKLMGMSVFQYIKQDPMFYNYFLKNDGECDYNLARRLIERHEEIS